MYGNVMNACGRAGRTGIVLDLMQEMRLQDGLEPNAFCYNIAVRSEKSRRRVDALVSLRFTR